MDVSTEIAVYRSSLPSETETLEPVSLPANGSSSRIEALNDELMQDSNGDLAISLDILSVLSSEDQQLASPSSNPNWPSTISTSTLLSEENLNGSFPSSHMPTLGNQILVPPLSNQDGSGSGSSLADDKKDASLFDSDQCMVSYRDRNHDDGVVEGADNDVIEPDSPTQIEPLNSSSDLKLVDEDVGGEDEDFGDSDELDEQRRSFRYYPLFHSTHCNNHCGPFDAEIYGHHPRRRIYSHHGGLIHWDKSFSEQRCRPCWEGREKGKNEFGPLCFGLPVQETGTTGVGAGLLNKGNTCYINAILQCFTHTVPLVQALRSCNHAMPCSTEGFCVLCVLRDHIELSLASSGKILEPLKLVNNLDNISSYFLRYQQEDAHEFLQCLLERLERTCLGSSPTDDNSSSTDTNIVERVFGGRLVSKLRCCNCGHCSDKYEPLIDLSLEIEDAYTLQSALQSFTKVEKIEDSEMKFRCENCKEEVAREKQLMLDQAPSVAALHLKRFKTDGTFVEKISKHIEFPLELDLKPYSNDNEGSNAGFNYQLYAVVVHKGCSLTSGHYLCYIRSFPNTWHKLDDPEVSKEQEDMVLSQAAYILFYAREGTPWCSSLIKPQEPCLDRSISNTSPKSVLDNVSGECTSVVNTESSEVIVKKDVIKETLTCTPCQRELDKVEISVSRDETERISGQISLASGSNFHCTRPIGDGPMDDVSVPLEARNCHNTDLYDEILCSLASEEDNCNQGAEKVRRNGNLHPPNPPRSPLVGGQPEVRFQIPRDHSEVENRRPSKRFSKDSQRTEALRCLKKMPTTRGMKLMAAMLPRNDNKLRSSLCKRVSPLGSRRKPMRVAVMR